MIRNKIGVCTLYTGYNYGSALQAFAIKEALYKLGFESEIVDTSRSLSKGRNINFIKILKIILRLFVHPISCWKPFLSYFESPSNVIDTASKEKFVQYYQKHLLIRKAKTKTIISEINEKKYFAFIAGSDQIWNSSAIFIDGRYFLEFVPKQLRIAFSPSFGRDFIPKYNKRLLTKKINGFKYISVREESGAKLIKKYCGKDAQVLCDPTLLLSSEEWQKHSVSPTLKSKYILCYFLGEKSEKANAILNKIKTKTGIDVVVELPYSVKCVGPQEFLGLISNASFVLTDSYHGTIFSIIFHKVFFTFERRYKNASNQSTRIVELLNRLCLSDRYDSQSVEINAPNFNEIDSLIKKEKDKALCFLIHVFNEIKGDHKDEIIYPN